MQVYLVSYIDIYKHMQCSDNIEVHADRYMECWGIIYVYVQNLGGHDRPLPRDKLSFYFM